MPTNRHGSIVVSWGSAIPGRERKLVDVFGRVLKYAGQLKQTGRVEDVRVFVPKIGAFRDTLMLFGNLDGLMAVLYDPEFEKLLVEGTIVVQALDVQVWEGGEPNWMSTSPDPYFEQLKNHGLI
jgi:hypothetical protein